MLQLWVLDSARILYWAIAWNDGASLFRGKRTFQLCTPSLLSHTVSVPQLWQCLIKGAHVLPIPTVTPPSASTLLFVHPVPTSLLFHFSCLLLKQNTPLLKRSVFKLGTPSYIKEQIRHPRRANWCAQQGRWVTSFCICGCNQCELYGWIL